MYLTVPQCYNDTVFLCPSNLQFWLIIDNRNHKYHQTDNMAVFVQFWAVFERIHRRLRIDLGLQGPINKKRILERSQVIF